MIQISRVDKDRPAEPWLIENLVRVFVEASRTRLQFLIDLHDADDDRAFFAKVVLPRNEVCLAESDGAVAGFIAFAPGWVNHLYVAPPFQRRGVGAKLLDLAKRHNDSLQLWVFETNEPAIRFYERHGFRVLERTDGAGNEAKQPDVRMRWDCET